MAKPADIALTLSYRQAHGWLSPWFEALEDGRALARSCPKCGRAWCPPLARCPYDDALTQWSDLGGSGHLLVATEMVTRLPLAESAASHVFALVRLEAAENAMFARLGLPLVRAVPGLRVRLTRAPDPIPHPAQAAFFVEHEAT